MVYQIRFKKSADKQLEKLDNIVRERIYNFLVNKVAKDPHILKEPLHGNKKGLWKYRVGDYRIVCEIKNKELIVLVVNLGHRREVYL